ncbi:MAG: polyribonucleotide nucleotidyltransferase [Desulfovibrionaceae bacterium]|jgi:polyribonucleotide nucleotidyltransferase|nr:polyribonucleotide nucleotidyltransferase [Desulfovibrionaceae bacterium]
MSENIFNATRVTAKAGAGEVLLETGRLANQADGAIWIQSGGTVVLCTVVTQPLNREVSFFPLVVDYMEKMYAAGRIPGSFFRREIGRPSEHETLCARLIDRPIRPLFPKAFRDEVQVLATVLSADQINSPDVLAVTGASAALTISKVPFGGPVAAVRVGRINGEFIANPTHDQTDAAEMNIVLAGSREAVVMVEGMATFMPEKVVAEAIEFGHAALQPLIDAQLALREQVGRPKIEVVAPEETPGLRAAVEEIISADLKAALQVPEKMARKDAKSACKAKLMEALAARPEYAEAPEVLGEADDMLGALTKQIVRARIKDEGVRIDGRDLTTVRPILSEVQVLPRAHGSALFARGETKVLVVATLGSGSDEQRMDSLRGDATKRFMLHYNFPPYCVGEVKMVRVSRREIGHGMLAERAITPVLPKTDEFPFTLRVVSETMESNGSSSMATVCGTSMALMDAGVPVSAPVAGTAMGLIKEGEDYYVLTDILGDEDALGDMDFKVAGTADGVTAVQMDIKIAGIPPEVMARALAQAKEARLHILGEMAKVIAAPREELSPFAPQLEVIHVNPDIIRVIIGPGGKNIKALTAETGAAIDIEDDGSISIFAPSVESLELAKQRIKYFDQTAELYKDYVGTVRRTLEIGAIVEILPNLEALVHISQLDTERVEKTEDVAKIGEQMKVKVIEINGDRIRASRKAVLLEERGEEFVPPEPRLSGGRGRDGGRDGGRGGRDGGRGGRDGGRGGRDGGGRRDGGGGRREGGNR